MVSHSAADARPVVAINAPAAKARVVSFTVITFLPLLIDAMIDDCREYLQYA
jgi:hypothetical protein